MTESLSMDDFQIVQTQRGEVKEYFIAAQSEIGSDPETILTRLVGFLEAHQAQLVNLRIFAQPMVRLALTDSDSGILKKLDCPITWLTQNDESYNYPLTLHAHAVAGVRVVPIHDDGQLVGRTFEDRYARYHQLCLVPMDVEADNKHQANELFERMGTLLRSVGTDFSSTVRTWLFVDQILSWYPALNEARDAFFNRHAVFDGLVPASTGIGAGNSDGAAIVAEALAIRPLNEQVCICKVVSPLQCEALDYKRSFSRATLIESPDYRRMYVSGTASIAPDGKTAHLNHTARQIELTMQVIHALIGNGAMGWENTVRAIAYFKDSRDFGLFDAYCRQAGIGLPHIKIQADVCRDDLLFELELDLLENR